MSTRLLSVLLAALAASVSLADVPDAHGTAVPLTAADAAAFLDGMLPSGMAMGDIAGATVTIVKDDAVLLTRAYGFADVEKRIPVSAEQTLFRPASISKLFTWTAVMQQVEAGKLDLDGDINNYLDFKIEGYDGAPIKLRHLLTHTAGFAGQQTPPAARGTPIQGEPTASGYIARLVERPLITRPGETFSANPETGAMTKPPVPGRRIGI